jgi:uncharacterized membrane protein YgcG
MKTKFLIYAIFVTVLTSGFSWRNFFSTVSNASSGSGGRSGSGWSSSTGGGSSGGGGGGHK